MAAAAFEAGMAVGAAAAVAAAAAPPPPPVSAAAAAPPRAPTSSTRGGAEEPVTPVQSVSDGLAGLQTDPLPVFESAGMRLKIPTAMAEVVRQRLGVLKEKTAEYGPPTPVQLGGFLRSCADGLRGAGIQQASAPIRGYFVETMADLGWDIKGNRSMGSAPPDFDKVVSWLEEVAAAEGEEATAKGLTIEGFNSRAGAVPLTSLLEEYGAFDPDWQKVIPKETQG